MKHAGFCCDGKKKPRKVLKIFQICVDVCMLIPKFMIMGNSSKRGL
jgi:hypothetical protein